MSKYELLLILPGTLDEKEAEQRSVEILKLVEEHGSKAEIIVMGKNRLAYPIRQIRYGYFYSIVFTAENSAVVALQKKLSLTRELLRAVISHFKVAAVANQPISYSTDNIPPISPERDERSQEKAPAASEKVVELANEETAEKTEKTASSAVARDLEKLNIDEINKKLDDLMSGDVIPSV